MPDWYVAPGPASPELASGIARELGVPVLDIEHRFFPDGEAKLRIKDDVRNKRIILVQSLYPPVDTHLMQLFQLSHRMSEDGAEVSAALPYICYARQDREFLEGEVVSIGVVAHLLRSAGIKRVLTVDIHSSRGLAYFSIPAHSVSAVPLLAKYITKGKGLENPLVISPDLGGSNRVEAFAKLIGSEYLALEKHRDRTTGEVDIEERDLHAKGRSVIIVDDIISTGSTLRKTAQLVKRQGVKAIIAVCSHPILVGDSLKKISESGVDQVIGSNTVPSPVSLVDVAPLIASYFRTLA